MTEGKRIFSAEDARTLGRRVGLKGPYVAEALYHLRRNAWVIPIRRGLYAISSTVPGTTPVHEFEIAMALVQPAAISHWSALHYHGLTDQVPRTVFVLTTTKVVVPRVRRSNRLRSDVHGYPLENATYQFVQVKPERFFGIEKVWVNDARISITDPERTLLDGLARPQYFGDFSEVLNAFQVRGPQLDVERIISYSEKLDEATMKRLGWVLQKQGVDQNRLGTLRRLPVTSYRKLDPTGPTKGRYNRTWMIQENLPGMVTR